MASASFPPPFHTGHQAAGGALLWCWDQIGRRVLPSAKSQASVPPVQQLAKMIILSNSFFFFPFPVNREREQTSHSRSKEDKGNS